MAEKNKRPDCVLGFYQVVEQPNGEMTGGILITSHLGRPIEFQCTLPVRPNATQQTLYGSTLRPFLIGELIATALRDRLQAMPDVLFVSQTDAMNPNTWKGIPLFCSEKYDEALLTQKYRETEFWMIAENEKSITQVLEKMTKFVPDAADLQEPLVRVEQALKEALGQAA